MKQYILLTFIAVSLSLTAVAAPTAEPFAPETEQTSDVKISVEDNQVHILGAQGLVLEVFDITGKKVAAYRIDANEKTIKLSLNKGCYILRVGKTARKISLS